MTICGFFNHCKEIGDVGIPAFVFEDGRVSIDPADVGLIEYGSPDACSINDYRSGKRGCGLLLKRRVSMKSILIKDTTKEEREQIIKDSIDCGSGCENCSSCWLGGGSPWDIYQDYIDGKREIREINAEYMAEYRQDRTIH